MHINVYILYISVYILCIKRYKIYIKKCLKFTNQAILGVSNQDLRCMAASWSCRTMAEIVCYRILRGKNLEIQLQEYPRGWELPCIPPLPPWGQHLSGSCPALESSMTSLCLPGEFWQCRVSLSGQGEPRTRLAAFPPRILAGSLPWAGAEPRLAALVTVTHCLVSCGSHRDSSLGWHGWSGGGFDA